MTFDHQPLEKHIVNAETTDKGRIYVTPSGRFPSVTTVLSAARDQTGLKRWRESLGHDKAGQILKQAQNRGNAIHKICEEYIKNNPNWRKGMMPVNLDSFKQFRPVLDINLQLVYGQELPLYSPEKLKAAGTADLVCRWDDINAIVDFKTARKEKTEEWCLGYLLQATAYSIMVEELYGIICPRIVILLARDHENEAQVLVREREAYYNRVVAIFNDPLVRSKINIE